jgi:hypothetical protein
MTEQAQDTLNLLRTSRHDPTKSAYERLNSPYDFNKWPMAPPGTKAVIWENPTTRQSWAPRGIDASYIGPSKDHYRLYKFYCPETQAIRVNRSTQFFPQHCKLPTLNPAQHANAVADELFESLKKLKKGKRKPLLRKIATQLEAIVTNCPSSLPRVTTTRNPDTAEQRVDVPETTNTSTNPAAPLTKNTLQYPRAHHSYRKQPNYIREKITPSTSEQPKTHRHRLFHKCTKWSIHHLPRGSTSSSGTGKSTTMEAKLLPHRMPYRTSQQL